MHLVTNTFASTTVPFGLLQLQLVTDIGEVFGDRW